MSKSELEQTFLQLLATESQRHSLTLLPPQREYRFHPSRKWRFDFAWPDFRVAVEIDGGIFVGGRHVDPLGGHGDRTKNNAAVALGWRVLRYDAKHMQDDPYAVFMEVVDTLSVARAEARHAY